MSVYFIQPEGEPAVKIGITSNVPARLSALQMAHHRPLNVIGIMPGGGREEAALHARFAAHRLRGEWFRLDDEIAGFVAALSKPATVWDKVHAAAEDVIRAIKADMKLKGDAAMSVKEISKKHKVSTASIYTLVGSKLGLHSKK